MFAFAVVNASLSAQRAGFNAGSRMDAFLKFRESRLDFDGVDFSNLYTEAKAIKPELPEPAIQDLVEKNVQFIFHNKLNRSSFLAVPHPGHIVKKIEQVLVQRRRLRNLVNHGKDLAGVDSSRQERSRLVRDVGKSAQTISKVFGEYFKESSSATFSMEVARSISGDLEFKRFLNMSEDISGLIDREVDSYFFRGGAAVVDVASFNSYSVRTLSDSLHQLSRLTVKRLR